MFRPLGRVVSRRVLVCGGRTFGIVRDPSSEHDVVRAQRQRVLLHRVLDYHHSRSPFEVVIDGAATGADTIAHQWAMQHDVHSRRFLADWQRYGRRAGAIRNKQMLDEGHPDLVIAFPGGPGTAMMVELAQARGIRVIEVGEDESDAS